MKAKSLSYDQVGIPSFSTGCTNPGEDFAEKTQGDSGPELTLFDLSSHTRARDAIRFGLKMRDKGFHVFVVGEDKSGRMNATLSYLKQHVKNMPPPLDWVYLNNFNHPCSPKAYSLPAGMGRVLRNALKELIVNLGHVLEKTLTSPHYLRQLDSLTDSFQYKIDKNLSELQDFSKSHGYDVIQGPEGFTIEAVKGGENIDESPYPVLQKIKDRLNRLSLLVHLTGQKAARKAADLKNRTAQKAIKPLMYQFQNEFSTHLGDWIDEFKADILKNIDAFVIDQDADSAGPSLNSDEWYGVNLFVDNANKESPQVLLEASPTYANLFGSIKYRGGSNGNMETNFTMIKPGALHHANGGILVLRADAIAKNPDVWEALKSALRDRCIRTEETNRENGFPLLDAPEPQPIPLDVQVFLIASPLWYYSFFINDPDFKSHFKIKADIDPDMDATPDNIHVYKRLIHQTARTLVDRTISEDAADYIVGYSTRWAGHREKLSARFELIGDILTEAAAISCEENTLSKALIEQTLSNRRLRNARTEDRAHAEISAGQILIQTSGKAIGMVNGLSVQGTGDHDFGMPCRISARTFAGEAGVVNIEQLTDMGGPIQQKSALILEGFLSALFAQKNALSCSCSLTFEQNYGGIEGDSASMAEVIAIISSLSGIPVRQDIAITGSMNQFGLTQSVGGVHHKIEGFHRVCKSQGFTGTQGVIVPFSNMAHLTLRENVTADIAQEKFFIWSVRSVFEAIEILMGTKCGIRLTDAMPTFRGYPDYCFSTNSVFSAVAKQLEKYSKSAQTKGAGRKG
ncbi:MAG: AAA family ATPase [Alphaproteobacteria bacterium]|nr:AAA family ATPase [Alphaproteobacteria bacterium]